MRQNSLRIIVSSINGVSFSGGIPTVVRKNWEKLIKEYIIKAGIDNDNYNGRCETEEFVMNVILNEIKLIMEQNKEQYLPQVKSSDLEENGAVYFMNSKDGTEFEWYVNDKLPPFMMFYDDEAKMGAVKLLLYRDGTVQVIVFDNAGKNMCKEVRTHIECGEEQLLDLAVLLKHQAEDSGKWNVNIESLCTDIPVSDEMRNTFLNHKSWFDEIKEIRLLMNQGALVSRRIVEEGWKVGLMYRREPNNPADSGWTFFAGNEDEHYNSDVKNIVLMPLGKVCQDLDRDVYKYITAPVGAEFIRISETEFEVDMKNKAIFLSKR